MAKRVTNIGVMVEQKPDTNKRRVSTVGVMVEQRPDTNKRRLAAIGLMVEYRILATPANEYGPLVQMM